MTRAFAALNQHELPPTTPGWVNIDHRSTQRVEADDLTALVRATWEVVPNGRVYIEAVHRLNDVGVAITYIASMGRRKRALTPSGGRSTFRRSTAT